MEIPNPTENAVEAVRLVWRKGPAQGGDGTARGNSWYDGDLLLVVINQKTRREVHTVSVSTDEGYLCIFDPYGDLFEWSVNDIAWYAVLNNSLPPIEE